MVRGFWLLGRLGFMAGQAWGGWRALAGSLNRPVAGLWSGGQGDESKSDFELRSEMFSGPAALGPLCGFGSASFLCRWGCLGKFVPGRDGFRWIKRFKGIW